MIETVPARIVCGRVVLRVLFGVLLARVINPALRHVCEDESAYSDGACGPDHVPHVHAYDEQSYSTAPCKDSQHHRYLMKRSDRLRQTRGDAEASEEHDSDQQRGRSPSEWHA